MLRQLLILGGLGAMLAGCGYYQVADPTTGRTYYTQMINDKWNGAISFDDARTGDHVTLQNHEVTKITHDQFEAAKRATVTVVPAPVPPPQPMPAGTVIIPGNSGVDVKIEPRPSPGPNPSAEPDDTDVRIQVD